MCDQVLQEVVSLSGKWRPSAVSPINQPSRANYWAESMEAWPTEPYNLYIQRGADSQENRLFKESAPQQFTFLGEKRKGEEVGAGLVTGKKD